MKGGIVVSCQADEGQPFCNPTDLSKMAESAALGGACGIRTDGPDNVKAIKDRVKIPILACYKAHLAGRKAYITPTLQHAWQLFKAGADMVAVECSDRDPDVPPIAETKGARLLIADISTMGEALYAQALGFDAVATTLHGHTEYTRYAQEFDFAFLAQLVEKLEIPVIAEGRIKTVEDARRALHYGAHAVVVGAAITNIEVTTRWFVEGCK